MVVIYIGIVIAAKPAELSREFLREEDGRDSDEQEPDEDKLDTEDRDERRLRLAPRPTVGPAVLGRGGKAGKKPAGVVEDNERMCPIVLVFNKGLAFPPTRSYTTCKALDGDSVGYNRTAKALNACKNCSKSSCL